MKILLVDDVPKERTSLKAILTKKGHNVEDFEGGIEAWNAITKENLSPNSVELAIIDQKMPRMDGFDFALKLKSVAPNAILVMLTAYASVDDIVKAWRSVFYDYWVKGKDDTGEELERNLSRVGGAIEERNRAWIQSQLSSQKSDKPSQIVYASVQMGDLLSVVAKLSGTEVSVLITGDSGTGKELIARQIHYESPRASQNLISVNCGAIPAGLVEAELFGYKKGAFTGAYRDHDGHLKTADGGTLFLDEIGTIPSQTQVKLLRALQEGEYYRLGSTQKEKSDFRLICATNEDLNKAIQSGQFREDLYYRIKGMQLHIPPLRERKNDVKPLIEHFAALYSSRYKKQVTFAVETIEVLVERYDWPGNVRELENFVSSTVAISESQDIITTASKSVVTLLNDKPPVKEKPLPSQHQPAPPNGMPSKFATLFAQLVSIERILGKKEDVRVAEVAKAAEVGRSNYSEGLQTIFTSKIIGEFFENYGFYVRTNLPLTLDYMKEHHKSAIDSCEKYSEEVKDFILNRKHINKQAQ